MFEASKREYEPAETLSRNQHVITWFCSLIAAAIMIETLFFKFTGAAESKYIFTQMGTEPWMRWVQGTWELLASIGLLWPRMRWAGGILTVGAMSAAILSHMTWLVMMIHRHLIPHYVSPSQR